MTNNERTALVAKCETLVQDWHEAGRTEFEAKYSNLNYDGTHYLKTVIPKRKYINLDDGDSGAFVVEFETGNVFCIKAYGVVDRKKLVGHIDDIDGAKLLAKRWWKLR